MVRDLLMSPYQDPDEVLKQSDFSDLVNRGVLTHNQAFLVYSLFHKQRMKFKKSVVNVEKEVYVLGVIPAMMFF